MLGLLLLVVGVSATWANHCFIPTGQYNYAKHGHASQSSTYEGSAGIRPGPELAIDGNDDNDYRSGSCMHTKKGKGEWWTVDIRKTTPIGVVLLTNRNDCCHDRLKGAEVRVGTSPNVNEQKSCGTITDVSKEKIAICCNGIVGRYITIIHHIRSDYIHVCEVQVFHHVKHNNQNVEDHK